MNKYNICGVVIHAAQHKQQQIADTLSHQQGVEVHASTPEGRLVVTVESDDNYYVADTISSFKDIDGVLTASMIYQCSDDMTTTIEGVPA